MFESLSNRLGGVFDRLRGRGALSVEDVAAAMREIRVALLEADVALPVAKEFIEKVKEKAVGQEVLRSVKPGQQVVKVVHDQLVEMLGADSSELKLGGEPPAAMLMVGLQGSGKTTTTAKLAKRLTEKENKKVLMASLDVYRPASQEQLRVLGEQINVASLPIVESEKPLEITKRALKTGRTEGYDVVILDTAGRLHIDNDLMDEVESVKKLANPSETLLIADAMTGQDAVNIAKNFNDKVPLTGIILTRIDGDTRGGAALSMRSVTGCPIKFLGTGEKIEGLEAFHPDRIAGRILDMGDVVSLVEKAAETIDQEDAEKLAKKLQKGQFDLNDLANQLKQIRKLGGAGGLMKMLPGMGKLKKQLNQADIDDSALKRQEAIIGSMTPLERRRPDVLKASRKRRIALGSGTTVQDVNRLLKQFNEMNKMMKRLGKFAKSGKMPAMSPDMMKDLENMQGGGLPPNLKDLLPPK